MVAAKWEGTTRIVFYVGAVLLIVAILFFVFAATAKKKSEGMSTDASSPPERSSVGAPLHARFDVHNHLSSPVVLSFALVPGEALESDGDFPFIAEGKSILTTLEGVQRDKTEISIQANDSKTLTVKEAKLFVPPGGPRTTLDPTGQIPRKIVMVDIVERPETQVLGVRVPYAVYSIDRPINALHIGMVTSRVVEPGMDNHRLIGNANQVASTIGGVPWITVRNPTLKQLVFSNGLVVPPMEKVKYLGRYHYGVPLGTWFRETSGLYPDFQLLQPQTDLYYGIISDLPQPAFGGEVYGQFTDRPTLPPSDWLFQTGWID